MKLVNISIKEKMFTSFIPLSFFDIIYLSSTKLSNSRYDTDTNIIYVEPRISNFEILIPIINTIEFIEWFTFLKEQHLSKYPVPTLYPFQQEAVNKILNCSYRGFLLGNSMGTGKTLTSLTAALKKSKKLFIVCPAPLMVQWKDEIKKWFNKEAVLLSGTKQKRYELYKTNEIPIKLISYDTLKNDYENKDLIAQIKGNVFICDECSKLKNKKSERYKSFKSILRKSLFTIYLSGTPVSKGLRDIHTIIQLIDYNIAGNIYDYCIMEDNVVGWGHNAKIYKVLVGYKNLDTYVNLISPIYERKTLEDIKSDMPSKTIKRINVTQSHSHHTIFKTIIKEYTLFTGFSLISMLDSGIINLQNSKSETMEILKEDLPKKYIEEKLVVLKELIEGIDNKVLIFSKYLHTISWLEKELKKEFKDKQIVTVTSSTKNKDEIRKDFNSGDIDIVIASETWAEGVSLPEIDYLINYDITPSIDKYLQKIDRIYRINSTRPKFIYNLVGDVIETHIMDILEEKLVLIENVTEGKAGIISEEDIIKQVINKLGE